MLHIDTRELHPGLIMSACRLSRAKEREMKEERRRRRSRRRRRRRRSGKGEVKGREEQQAVQPRVPGGAQMFIPVDLSSPLAPPSAPLRAPRYAPFTSGSCGEGARPRQSSVAERCIYVMRALVARMHSQWRRNRLPSLRQTEIWQARSHKGRSLIWIRDFFYT